VVAQALEGHHLSLGEALANQEVHQGDHEAQSSLEQGNQAIPGLYHCKVVAPVKQ
jgi:hypothetical protein